MNRQRIILLFVTLWCVIGLSAQNADVNMLKTINGWHVHGLSRTLSVSGVALPVGVPTVMGIYAIIKKDRPLLKDAIYIGSPKSAKHSRIRV